MSVINKEREREKGGKQKYFKAVKKKKREKKASFTGDAMVELACILAKVSRGTLCKKQMGIRRPRQMKVEAVGLQTCAMVCLSWLAELISCKQT